jgi:peroxiredoxin
VDARKEAEEDKEVEALKAGDPAPELALPKLGGGDWNLTAARPKPVVVSMSTRGTPVRSRHAQSVAHPSRDSTRPVRACTVST